MRVQFRVLGSVEIVDDLGHVHTPNGRTASLLAALLVQPDVPVDRQDLVRALWPAGSPASAAANLRQYAARCRQLLNACADGIGYRLRSAPAGYRLHVRRDELDLTLFEDRAEQGRQAATRGDLAQARDHLEAALGLWRGRLGQGATLGTEIEHRALYWDELRLGAHHLLAQTRLGLGEYQQAIAELRPLLSAHPFREEFAGMLMLALYRSYRKGEALRIYSQTRRRFVESLGLEPTRDLQQLQQGILAENLPLDDRGFAWLRQPSTDPA
ncbi:hypothetical protein AWW66_08915 [Micromonospora rosaria]|uniref:Bacterial transcriptional activator domain-containing protein n=1 Tax=Micromonospora rosaria TaxID=47874 RepID=A0A136PV53_9ACTN|nr:hypothetical protein AWW66_08915 [Micromonospora rosaria]